MRNTAASSLALITLLLLFGQPTLAEPIEDRETLFAESTFFVSAPAGLFLRRGPVQSAPQIRLLKFAVSVSLLEEKPNAIQIGTVAGKWTRVSVGNDQGWVFGGYLSKEVPPSPGLRHWNRGRNQYFTLASDHPEVGCYTVSGPTQCSLKVFDRNHKQIAEYQGSTSTQGWRNSDLILTGQGADGAGGGNWVMAWSPTTGKSKKIRLSMFMNFMTEEHEEKRQVTYLECAGETCFYVEHYIAARKCSIFIGEPRATNKFLSNLRCLEQPRLESRGPRIFLTIDGSHFELLSSGALRVSEVPK
jgi:hypothetical protein